MTPEETTKQPYARFNLFDSFKAYVQDTFGVDIIEAVVRPDTIDQKVFVTPRIETMFTEIDVEQGEMAYTGIKSSHFDPESAVRYHALHKDTGDATWIHMAEVQAGINDPSKFLVSLTHLPYKEKGFYTLITNDEAYATSHDHWWTHGAYKVVINNLTGETIAFDKDGNSIEKPK